MRALRERIHYEYLEGGFRGLSRNTLRYLREVVRSDTHWLIYERNLRGGTVRIDTTVVHRELSVRDLLDLGYFKALKFPQTIKRRMDAGNVCHGFFTDSRLATIGWSSSEYLELDVGVRFSCPHALGLFDFFTYEAFRSRGYYTNALTQLIVIATQLGFSKAHIAVDPGNIPSIKGIERAGFCRVLRTTRRRRFGLRNIVTETYVQRHLDSRI